jgi:hypothetical protein
LVFDTIYALRLEPLTSGTVFKGASQEVTDFYSQLGSVTIPGVPPLDPGALVDGERAIYFLKPLPVTSAGRNFETCEKVLGVFDKGKSGTIVETEITITDTETNETYVRIIGSFFYVGQGGWGGPRGTKAPSDPMPDRDPDGTLEVYVQEESAHLYRYAMHSFSCYHQLIPVPDSTAITIPCTRLPSLERRWALEASSCTGSMLTTASPTVSSASSAEVTRQT